MTSDREAKIIDAIANAEDIEAPVACGQPGQKPRLLIENCDPDRTVVALRDILSRAGGLYDRGVPVRLAFDKIQGGTVAQVMTPDALVLGGRIPAGTRPSSMAISSRPSRRGSTRTPAAGHRIASKRRMPLWPGASSTRMVGRCRRPSLMGGVAGSIATMSR